VTTELNHLVDSHPAKGLIGGNLTFNVPSNTNLQHVRGFYVYVSTHASEYTLGHPDSNARLGDLVLKATAASATDYSSSTTDANGTTWWTFSLPSETMTYPAEPAVYASAVDILQKHSGRVYLSVFPYSTIATKSRSTGSFKWTDLYLDHYDSDLSYNYMGGYVHFPNFGFENKYRSSGAAYSIFLNDVPEVPGPADGSLLVSNLVPSSDSSSYEVRDKYTNALQHYRFMVPASTAYKRYMVIRANDAEGHVESVVREVRDILVFNHSEANFHSVVLPNGQNTSCKDLFEFSFADADLDPQELGGAFALKFYIPKFSATDLSLGSLKLFEQSLYDPAYLLSNKDITARVQDGSLTAPFDDLVTQYNVYYSNDVVGVGAKVNLIKEAANPFDLSVEHVA
jgi:hypothetical protein